MIANSIVEIFSIVYSFQLYNLVWDVLTGTGLAYLPFVVAVIASIASIKGDASHMVRDLEMKVIGMIVVLMLLVVPYEAFQTHVNQVSYRVSTGDCYWGNSTGQADDADLSSARDAFGSLTDNSAQGTDYDAKMPLGWFMVSTFSSALTYTTIKGMGCSYSYTRMMSEMSKAPIVDENETGLTERVGDFVSTCYKPALAVQQELGGTDRTYLDAIQDINWIGSRELYRSGGAYWNESLYMQGLEDQGFSYDSDRESDAASAKASPYCAQVWLGDGTNATDGGLRGDLLREFRDQYPETEEAFDEFGYKLFVADGTYDQEQMDDLYLKMMMANQGAVMLSGPQVSADGDNGVEDVSEERFEWSSPSTWGNASLDQISSAVAGAGMAAGVVWNGLDNLNAAATALLMKEAFIQAVPILMSLAQAVVIIVAPIAMVMGGYKIGTFMLLALAYFSLEFTNAIIIMGTLFEQRLNLFSGDAMLTGDIDATLVLIIVGITQLFLLPTIFFAIMVNVGGAMMKGMQSAGGQGAGGNIIGGATKAGSALGSAGRHAFATSKSRG